MGAFSGRWIRILFQASGIVLFAFILSRLDLRETAAAYRRFDARYALFVLVTMALFILVKGFRWKRIVAAQGTSVPAFTAFRIYAAALFLGEVTPGRLGDFAKSLYLVNAGMRPGKAIFGSILDRLLDVVFLVAIGYVSLLLLPGIFENQLLLSSLLVVVTAGVVLAVFLRRNLLKRFTSRFARRITPSRFHVSLDALIADTLDEFRLFRAKRLGELGALTLAAWVLHYQFFIVTARVLGIDASVTILVASISAAIFTSLLPVSLLGIGTRDAVLILIFDRIGASREAAVSFSFTFVLVYLVIGILGLCFWLTAPFLKKGAVPSADSEVDRA